MDESSVRAWKQPCFDWKEGVLPACSRQWSHANLPLYCSTHLIVSSWISDMALLRFSFLLDQYFQSLLDNLKSLNGADGQRSSEVSAVSMSRRYLQVQTHSSCVYSLRSCCFACQEKQEIVNGGGCCGLLSGIREMDSQLRSSGNLQLTPHCSQAIDLLI